MYENYYSERIYDEQVTTNEYLVDIKEDIKTTNTYLNSILLVCMAIAILKSADMVHHLLDKFYKNKK